MALVIKVMTALILLLLLLGVFVTFSALAEETYKLQPQQFRFQQPPSLDIRPEYGEPKPCR